ncbi:MAG: PRC-barrel domain-containing protein [Alphaproteobacteria bacterium]|nr:PRC-barrel domain-containing protein [Alphaproteobacteria bacterium]
MKLSLMLSTAMVLALGGAALAQDNPYTHMSTPQERAQTSALNQSQLDQSQADPSLSSDTAQATAPPTQLAYNDSADDSQYQADQDRYQDQQSQYQDRQAQYQDDQDRYHDQLDRYRDQRADNDAYDDEYADNDRYAWDDLSGPTALDEIAGAPRARLIGMDVERANGRIVGQIQDIDMRADGRIDSVEIALRNGNTAWVRAASLRYDPNAGAVLTGLTMAELNSLARNG